MSDDEDENGTEDPFARLGDADREGDPFEELERDTEGDRTQTETAGGEPGDSGGTAETPGEYPGDATADPDDSSRPSGSNDATSSDADAETDPFAGLGEQTGDADERFDTSGESDERMDDPLDQLREENSLDDATPAERSERQDESGHRTGGETDIETEEYDAHDVTPPTEAESEWFDGPTAESAGEETAASDVQGDAGPESGEKADDPFSGPGEREGDPFASVDSIFERMDVEELDAESVWEDLSDAQRRGSVTEVSGRTYAEVSKHRFCEQCEYFSAPPDVACSHEGTEILEFLDMETVRVVDCPVVAERRELQRQE